MPNSIIYLHDTGKLNMVEKGPVRSAYEPQRYRMQRKKFWLWYYSANIEENGCMEVQILLAYGYPERRCL